MHKIHRDGLTDMQRNMLDCVADDGQRAEIHARFVAGNAPHPFDQVRFLSLHQRLCGLPALARERALARIGKGNAEAGRYTGIVATSVGTHHHNLSTGGSIHTVYAEQFGWKAQLGVIVSQHGSIDHAYGDTVTVHSGRWVRVEPVGVHSDRGWGYVWLDGLYTRVDRRPKRGLAVDSGTVPVVFRVQVTAGGHVIGTGTATTLPHRMRESAEDVREQFAAQGVTNAVVTYWPA